MSSVSQVTFNSLMTACLNDGTGLDEALCVLDDMEAARFSSDVVMLNILIGACSRFGWLEEREVLLVDMKAAGIEPKKSHTRCSRYIGLMIKSGALGRG
jgi:pentatricopeptide repeat protein